MCVTALLDQAAQFGQVVAGDWTNAQFGTVRIESERWHAVLG
jgi:hypothetical protein